MRSPLAPARPPAPAFGSVSFSWLRGEASLASRSTAGSALADACRRSTATSRAPGGAQARVRAYGLGDHRERRTCRHWHLPAPAGRACSPAR
jgi:hypothetical protein